jgi:hypothetical protein
LAGDVFAAHRLTEPSAPSSQAAGRPRSAASAARGPPSPLDRDGVSRVNHRLDRGIRGITRRCRGSRSRQKCGGTLRRGSRRIPARTWLRISTIVISQIAQSRSLRSVIEIGAKQRRPSGHGGRREGATHYVEAAVYRGSRERHAGKDIEWLDTTTVQGRAMLSMMGTFADLVS